MKKAIGILCMLALVASAYAGMNQRNYSITVVGTNTATAVSAVRGELEKIQIDVPSGATGTVTVKSGGDTVFSKSGVSADATFYPVTGVCGTDGSTVSNEYKAIPLCGPLTVAVTGTGTATNTFGVTVVYKP